MKLIAIHAVVYTDANKQRTEAQPDSEFEVDAASAEYLLSVGAARTAEAPKAAEPAAKGNAKQAAKPASKDADDL